MPANPTMFRWPRSLSGGSLIRLVCTHPETAPPTSASETRNFAISAGITARSERDEELPLDPLRQARLDRAQQLIGALVGVQDRAADHFAGGRLSVDLEPLSRARRGGEEDLRTAGGPPD